MRHYWRLFFLLMGVVCAANAAMTANVQAHEVRPGYIEINETAPDEFAIIWKQPVRDGANNVAGLGLYPVFPINCERLSDSRMARQPGALIEQFALRCTGGLKGQLIGVEGLQKTITDVFVRLVELSGATTTLRLTADAPVQKLRGGGVGLAAYFGLGVEHLLFGYDHILFVLGLVLLVTRWTRLFWVITAFTLAHSITLALAILGGWALPSAPVEAAIALSILFVAVELTLPPERRSPIARDFPQIVAFGFGLLHGFGFAGVLADIGLPREAAGYALALFNVGLEVGQLMLVAAILILRQILAPHLKPILHNQPIVAPILGEAPILAMGGLAIFWLVTRSAQIIGY